jgi:hypothetical protein
MGAASMEARPLTEHDVGSECDPSAYLGTARAGSGSSGDRYRVKAVAPGDGPVVVALDETRNYGAARPTASLSSARKR